MWLYRTGEKLEVPGQYGRKSLKCLDETGESSMWLDKMGEKVQVLKRDVRKALCGWTRGDGRKLHVAGREETGERLHVAVQDGRKA
jgi:hypothetical protein